MIIINELLTSHSLIIVDNNATTTTTGAVEREVSFADAAQSATTTIQHSGSLGCFVIVLMPPTKTKRNDTIRCDPIPSDTSAHLSQT